jgi:integrase
MMKPTACKDAEAIRIGDKVRIGPRGKRGIYVADFFNQGQHRRRSLKTSRLDIARQRAIRLEADLASGEYQPQAVRLALSEAQTDFLNTKEGEGVKPKTLVKYLDWVSRFAAFAAGLEVRYLHQVTPQLFERFRAEQRKTQSEKSLYTGLIIIKGFMKFFSGGARDVLRVNPVARCKVTLPYVAPKFTPALDQVNAILAAATGDRKLQYAVAALSGIRLEELAMLSPENVDLKGGWIHIVGHDDWTPKTRQARKIPIHPRLAAMLASVKDTPRRFYFCAPPSKQYPKGDQHLNVRQINEDLQELAKSLGIPVGREKDGLVFHSLRHYFETQCVDSGVPEYVVDAWMGHAGRKAMGRSYYGRRDVQSQQYMRKVNF